MNDLRNVRDVLYSFSHCVKDEYQDLYISIVGMIDSYMDKEQLTSEQYPDDVLGAMCDAAELEQTKRTIVLLLKNTIFCNKNTMICKNTTNNCRIYSIG